MEVKTKSGFTCSVNESVFDDMELLDLIAELENGGSVIAYNAIVKKVIPNDKERLYNHVRTDDGRVPITAISAEITEIFTAVKDGKK